jgi:hypothetical protein
MAKETIGIEEAVRLIWWSAETFRHWNLSPFSNSGMA